jgi:hypothetical protein
MSFFNKPVVISFMAGIPCAFIVNRTMSKMSKKRVSSKKTNIQDKKNLKLKEIEIQSK